MKDPSYKIKIARGPIQWLLRWIFGRQNSYCPYLPGLETHVLRRCSEISTKNKTQELFVRSLTFKYLLMRNMWGRFFVRLDIDVVSYWAPREDFDAQMIMDTIERQMAKYFHGRCE